MTVRIRRVFSLLFAVAAVSACTEEERTLAVDADLIVTRQGGAETQTLDLGSRLSDSQLSPQAFQDAWDAAFNGDDIGTGLALSTGGGADEVAGKAPLIGLMVVLPT